MYQLVVDVRSQVIDMWVPCFLTDQLTDLCWFTEHDPGGMIVVEGGNEPEEDTLGPLVIMEGNQVDKLQF